MLQGIPDYCGNDRRKSAKRLMAIGPYTVNRNIRPSRGKSMARFFAPAYPTGISPAIEPRWPTTRRRTHPRTATTPSCGALIASRSRVPAHRQTGRRARPCLPAPTRTAGWCGFTASIRCGPRSTIRIERSAACWSPATPWNGWALPISPPCPLPPNWSSRVRSTASPAAMPCTRASPSKPSRCGRSGSQRLATRGLCWCSTR